MARIIHETGMKVKLKRKTLDNKRGIHCLTSCQHLKFMIFIYSLEIEMGSVSFALP